MFIDSHAHFDMCLEADSLTEEQMLSALKENNIKFVVQVSTEPDIFKWSYEFAKRNPGIFFTLGIHPSSNSSEDDLISLSDFIHKVIKNNERNLLFGIGETGLDYYRMKQPKNMQIHSFEYQIDIAKKNNLPLIVHSRDAKEDTFRILRQNQLKIGIIHCFSGDSKVAREFLDLGFYISFAGNLTYKKASDLHDAASYVPLDRLLLETDAPYLTPEPLRGRRNRSEYIVNTYDFIARLRNEKLSKIMDNIYNNFFIICSVRE